VIEGGAVGRPHQHRTPPADQSAVRRHNLSLVLRLLHAEGPRSRAAIAVDTGLNKVTVSSLVAELEDRGLVRDIGLVSAPTTRAGRPATLIELDGRQVIAIGAELNVDHIAVLAMDVAGRRLFERERPLDAAATPRHRVIQALATLINQALDAVDSTCVHLAGVTLAVPGIVDVTTDILRFAPNLGWREVPLIELLSRALGRSVPMAMDNEATLGALAEYRVGQFAGTRNLLYVIGEVGIGAGLVIDGSLVRGASGFAGEAGHMQVDPDGPLCRCGSRGCLETYIGLWPLLRAVVPDLARSLEDDVNLGPKAKVAYAVARAEEGDKRALAAFEELGRWLGRGLGNLVNLLNPQVVILGGHFIDTSPFVLASAIDELRATAMSAEVSGVRVVPSTLGFSPSSLGGAIHAAERVFEDPTSVASQGEAPARLSARRASARGRAG
jgi:predicted NBD/HSP70 family sugar kinase